MSFWDDLADPVFDGVALAGFKSRANAFFIGLSCSISTIVFYYFSLSLLSVNWLALWGWGLSTIIHFFETKLQYNWHNNKNADGLVNRLANNLVILNQPHRAGCLIGQKKI